MCKHKLSKESASPDSTGLIRLTVTELVLDWTHGPEPLYRLLLYYSRDQVCLTLATGLVGPLSCGVCHLNESSAPGGTAVRKACAGLGEGGAPCRVALPCPPRHLDGAAELLDWMLRFNVAASHTLSVPLRDAWAVDLPLTMAPATGAAADIRGSFIARALPPEWLITVPPHLWGEGWLLVKPATLDSTNALAPASVGASALKDPAVLQTDDSGLRCLRPTL